MTRPARRPRRCAPLLWVRVPIAIIALLALAWLVNERWYVWASSSDGDTFVRVWRGRVDYGCYERLQLPGGGWRVAAHRVTPGAARPMLCHEVTAGFRLWWVMAGLAAMPILFVARSAGRRGPGACAWCGYDLTGLAEGPCPECGRAHARPGA